MAATVSAVRLETLWEARERGGLCALESQLKDLGVHDVDDRSAIADILRDPFAMGDAPRPKEHNIDVSDWVLENVASIVSSSTSSRSKSSKNHHMKDVTLLNERLAAALAVRGLGAYARVVASHAGLLWHAREDGAFEGLEEALRDEKAFGQTDTEARAVFAALLLKPAALPYRANLGDEADARGLKEAAAFARQHEFALCASRDADKRLESNERVTLVLQEARRKLTSTSSSSSLTLADDDSKILSRLANLVYADRERFPGYRDTFAAAPPPSLKTRAALVWLRAKARRGAALVATSSSKRRRRLSSVGGGGGPLLDDDENSMKDDDDDMEQRAALRASGPTSSRVVDETARALHATLAALDPAGALQGVYDDCARCKGSRVESRRRAFIVARDKYGLAPLDPADPSLATVNDANDNGVLGVYVSELAKRSCVANAPGALRGGWLRRDIDDFSSTKDYSEALATFVRCHVDPGFAKKLRARAEEVEEEKEGRLRDAPVSLPDAASLLSFLAALDKYAVDKDPPSDDLFAPCPKPSGNAKIDFDRAVRRAADIWGTPETPLSRIDDDEDDESQEEEDPTKKKTQKLGSFLPRRERLEAFLTELLIRLPDEAFDRVDPPPALPTFDALVMTNKYDNWRKYAAPTDDDNLFSTTKRSGIDEAETLAISE